jgi:Uma2 family endonuclease
VAVDLPSPLHRISPEEYRRLVEAGVFDEDARVELIDGLLVDMSPKTRAHENAIAWLLEALMASVDLARFQVRVGAPLTIGWSEPEPDLIVIERDVPRPHHRGRPRWPSRSRCRRSGETSASSPGSTRAPAFRSSGWSTSTDAAS